MENTQLKIVTYFVSYRTSKRWSSRPDGSNGAADIVNMPRRIYNYAWALRAREDGDGVEKTLPDCFRKLWIRRR